MRKLIVGSFVSLDGVIEAPMTWAPPFFVGDALEHSYQKAGEVEYFLLGRVTYELFSSRWPQIQGKYMDRMNGLKKLVASRSLKEVGWNASLIEGDVTKGLAAIKAQGGGDILKYGISQLDQTLLAGGLVDEYQLSILPIRVGQGKRAFQDVDPSLVRLELTDTRRFESGIVTLTYRVLK
ncbi:dihydrofolate reductase family protein [Mesorhizobium sp. CA14]|uniref:dihydrofolate reductase family protein n=1 Tax=Mesorhizobium sp. CA14 TaxID=2876642 RepID=UPI001CCBC5FB|nr:dihydrofolate reductase family protein [Mesorhizobium sp. CA14]MBZ9849915.1 dihydrofolate reductase family protein [Mesorhizobium sp. CA14]